MAQKVYGIIPHSADEVGYSQDTPVADHDAMKAAMLAKIERQRKRDKAKKDKGVVASVKDTLSNLEKKKKALKEASSGE
jgi:hypothetical protein